MTISIAGRMRRRWPRYRLDVPIRLIVQTANKISVIVGRGNELNEGGMALTAGVELRLGDEIHIEFTPPYSGSPIRIRGVVRNRAGYRYGMEFHRRWRT
ncbi:MAG TPA: PilZ domain-containing protein [Terriglobales bacterium]|nr:PilZ domain-containing protein [Terriglobales bacterium]